MNRASVAAGSVGTVGSSLENYVGSPVTVVVIEMPIGGPSNWTKKKGGSGGPKIGIERS